MVTYILRFIQLFQNVHGFNASNGRDREVESDKLVDLCRALFSVKNQHLRKSSRKKNIRNQAKSPSSKGNTDIISETWNIIVIVKVRRKTQIHQKYVMGLYSVHSSFQSLGSAFFHPSPPAPSLPFIFFLSDPD